MVELLKQDQYQPMPVERQILAIFIGVNGFLDELPAASVRKFEAELLKFMESKYPELLSEIREKKTIEDASKEKISQAIQSFKAGFSPE